MPQSLYELIAAHATAFARFERVCDRTDETLARQEGRTVTEDDHRVWEEAEAVLDKALDALVLAVPENVVELHRIPGLAGSAWHHPRHRPAAQPARLAE